MEIIKLPLGVFQANCYIIPTLKNKAVIIDPGASGELILEILSQKNLEPEALLFTHGHFDHVGGATPLIKAGAKTYIHTDDAFLLADPSAAGEQLFPTFDGYESMKPDMVFQDGDILNVAGITVRVMHTPGHTRGSSLFFYEDLLFTGDTLFEGSIGRTDFIGSNPQKMKHSLQKIKELQDNYKILPGHGDETDLQKEKETNPYLGRNYDDIF